MAEPATGKGKEVMVVEDREEEEEGCDDEFFEEMELLRLLDIQEGREEAPGRQEDMATTSEAANRRIVPAFGGVIPGGIWADCAAGPPSPTTWMHMPHLRHGDDVPRDHHSRSGHVLVPNGCGLQVQGSSSISRRADTASWPSPAGASGGDMPRAARRPPRRDHHHQVAGEKLVVYLANNEEMVLHTLFHAPLNEAHFVAEAIVDHVVDIMYSIHGKRLLGRVLDSCCSELHEAIVAKITQHRDSFYRICVERSDGVVRMIRSCRSRRSCQLVRADGVVRMIRSCRSRRSCQLVRDAVAPWVGRASKMQSLVMDSDRLRVVQACVQCFPSDITKVLVDAIVDNCIEMVCHPNGLLFLQNCLVHMTSEEKYNIFTQVCINSIYLAKHRSGNYIVQDVLELGDSLHLEIIASCFKTHYLALARQKYSSRVVEKCLKKFGNLEQYLIICELILDLDQLRDLVTDEVANYVISTALLTCTVPIRDILANAIISLQIVNQRHPHCLKIFDILSQLGYI